MSSMNILPSMHDSLPITDNCDLCVEVRHHQKGSRFTNGNGVSNALAKAGIELGENGSIFPRPKGKPRSQIKRSADRS